MATVDTNGQGLIQFDNVAVGFGPGQSSEVRNRYQWSLQFGPTANFTGGAAGNLINLNTVNNNVGFYVRTTELPRATIETQTLNQYNIRRNVSTHVSYEPLTMTFYDTIDNTFLQYIQSYLNFKFMNWENAPNVRAPFGLGSGYVPEFGPKSMQTGFGQGGLINGVNFGDVSLTSTLNDNFASYITITKEMTSTDSNAAGSAAQQITIYNPKVVDISQDTLDYSDGTSVLTWTVTWRYESYEFAGPKTPGWTATTGLTGDAARAVLETGRTIGRFFTDIARRVF
jgi:hypothetical protein